MSIMWFLVRPMGEPAIITIRHGVLNGSSTRALMPSERGVMSDLRVFHSSSLGGFVDGDVVAVFETDGERGVDGLF